MLQKFQSKSSRVKGVSFHNKRPWVLTSLHSGTIQLWDYRSKTLIDKFEEHEGPVRAVAFHQSQPLFVSGGDDYKIRLWNHNTRRCICVLTGHLDYIRTVGFHNEYPWIISSSDDQTVRIWNWQSRHLVAILTGHNHYVMSAVFHCKEPWVVSASLDFTVRVWDLSSLKRKSTKPVTGATNEPMFGSNDVIVKHVLEGHDRGVNCAAFHPTLPLIVSGADDRLVKLWRMSETKAWEVDTFRGHHNNVSSVMFHPARDWIISNSEDKTVRVWDISKRSALAVFRREHDRFWTLAMHPELDLMAAGHDTGCVVFKLERERPAFCTHENVVYVCNGGSIKSIDMESESVSVVASFKKSSGLNSGPKTLSYNPAEKSFLVSNNNGTSVEWIQGSNSSAVQGSVAVFVARHRFALLDGDTIQVRSHKNELLKTIPNPCSGPLKNIFYAGTAHVIVCSTNDVALIDVQQEKIVQTLDIVNIRRVIHSNSFVALISKHHITLANTKLVVRCSIKETSPIKSAVFDEQGVLIYSTLNHLKYLLYQGDCGIIKTISQPLYVCGSSARGVHVLNRFCQLSTLKIDTSEFKFKMALLGKQYDDVMAMIRGNQLIGQSVIAYVRDKGFPEIALMFVKDPQSRFELALECGTLEIALEAAKSINSEETWNRLAFESIRQGNITVGEVALQQMKHFDRLSFLYFVTGNVEKLGKMSKIAEMRGDVMSWMQNAILSGQVQTQFNILLKSGNRALAYFMSKTYGLSTPDDLKQEASSYGVDKISDGKCVSPLLPFGFRGDWPIRSDEARVMKNEAIEAPVIDQRQVEEEEEEEEEESFNTPNDDGWGIEQDLDGLDLEEEPIGDVNSYMFPSSMKPLGNTKLIDFIQNGEFDNAFKLLQSKGVRHVQPFKPLFLDLSHSAGLPSCPNGPTIAIPLSKNFNLTIDSGLDLTTQGKFVEALEFFRKLILVQCITQDSVDPKCVQYIQGLIFETTRKEMSDPTTKEALELAILFTHCALDTPHLILALRSAMVVLFKAKNYESASTIAKRLLELDSSMAAAKKVLVACDKNGLKDAIHLNVPCVLPVGTVVGSSGIVGSGDSGCSFCGAKITRVDSCPICLIGGK